MIATRSLLMFGRVYRMGSAGCQPAVVGTARCAVRERSPTRTPQRGVPTPSCRFPVELDIHSMNRFQQLVAAAKKNITEVSPAEARAQSERGGAFLIDVREEDDWREDHAKGAKHLERGIIELEIEEQVPDLKAPIICYCGGGSRSALVAESLQKMGYENVRSMAGGFRAWKEAGLPSSD